jgi:hypothetical protein
MKTKTDQHEASRFKHIEQRLDIIERSLNVGRPPEPKKEFKFGELPDGTQFYLAASPYDSIYRGDKFFKITAVEDAGSALLNAINLNTAGAAHIDWATPCFLPVTIQG